MTTVFPRSHAILRATVGTVMSVVIVACSGDSGLPNAPPAVTGAELTITPATIELTPGETRLLQVTVRDESGAVVPSPVVQWKTTNAGVATVNATGSVAAVSIGNANVVATSNGLSDTAEVRVIALAPSATAIDVYPEVTYQVMLGWEGTAQIGEVECDPTAFPIYQQEVLNRLVNELGVNRVRLEIRSGHENPVDYYAQFRVHRRESDWVMYESINDNSDPHVANLAGFQFSELDHKEEAILRHLRAALAARGERLYVTLNYVDFGPALWEQSSDPEEYAELIHTAFLHLQSAFGWVPDAVEMVLEPDNTRNWTPQVIGRALVATGDRLKASGFHPAFIAPSTTNMATALTYLDQLLTVPRVREYLTDISYHRYSGVSTATLAAIASRASEYGLRTAMLEHIGSGYEDLHQDLRLGMNSTWQQYGLAGCPTEDRGGQYYRIDKTVPTAPKVILNSRSRYFRQYFSFIRINAIRVGAVTGNPNLDPLAFRNTNGKLVIVVKASQGAAVQVRRIPVGSYGVTYTTDTQTFVSLPDVPVSSTGVLQVAMPAAGVITIYQR